MPLLFCLVCTVLGESPARPWWRRNSDQGRKAWKSQRQQLIKSYCLFGNQSPEPSRSADKQKLLDRGKGLKGSKEIVLIN